MVFAPVVCATAPATDDVVTGLTLDGVIIHSAVDIIDDCGVLEDVRVTRFVADVIIASPVLVNVFSTEVVIEISGPVVADVSTGSLLNDAVTEECNLSGEPMVDVDNPVIPKVDLTDDEELLLEQFTATYKALKPVYETFLSDLNTTNIWFDEEYIPSMGGGRPP